MKRILLVVLVLWAVPVWAQRGQTAPFRIADEGTALASRPLLDFVGTTVSCVVSGAKIVCTFTGGSAGHTIKDEGTSLTARDNLNCVGTNIACVDDAGNNETEIQVGTIAIAGGGTGQTGQTAAFDALAPTTTGGDISYHNGTDNVRLGIGASGYVLGSTGSAPAWVAGAQVISKGSSQTGITSTTYIDITDLGFTVPANRAFAFKCHLVYQSTNTGNGLAFAQNSTGGTGVGYDTLVRIQTNGNDANSTDAITETHTASVADGMTTTTAGVVAANTSYFAEVDGFFYSGTSGDPAWSLRVKSEGVAATSIGVYVFSHCWIAYIL